ncbi:hypothetical protein [Mycolicibacterium sp.]|uniref:hypothetical protein n=1 Tax=Mycolicibacterium sp. TaxID=2320850 RepID=UPI0025F121CC|nr:hypothetical protein [Mycolicibacterium sp.]
MNEREDDPEDRSQDRDQEWDDVVDVICVGSTPGVLAYLSACEASDLDVLHVAAPAAFDHETGAYLAAMTEDLDACPDQSEPALTKAAPAPLRRDGRGRPDTLDPFFGEQLRTWSARCLASPFAVLLTEVSGVFTRMRTDDGETICAVAIPEKPTPEDWENGSTAETFAGFVYEYGRLAGAVLDDGSGPRTVRAEAGLALPIGPAGEWPDARSLAMVSRPAGRFARLEVLESVTDE